MSDTKIACPNCGTEIEISEALDAQLRKEIQSKLESEQQLRLKDAVAAAKAQAQSANTVALRDLQNQLNESQDKTKTAEERELTLLQQTRALKEEQKSLAKRVEAEVKAQADAELQKATDRIKQQLIEQSSAELSLLKEQLKAQQEKTRTAQEAELKLRKQQDELKQREAELELEVSRKIDAQRQLLETQLRSSISEEQNLKLKEKQKQIDDLKSSLEEAKRRSEVGSQELQGEVLELDVQAELESRFVYDEIQPVPKGIRGADILHQVQNNGGNLCGTIIWETKNTKQWNTEWLAKLKEDQRQCQAHLAVLVSAALPDGVNGFSRIDGVWVSDLKSWPALAAVLREQIIEVAFAHAASEGKQEKMELLYDYLAGNQFQSRVQGIVEAFTAMQEQILKEKRAMEKQWRERDKQLERVMLNTTGLYGELRGIAGSSIPSIPSLELDDETDLLEQNEKG